MADSPESPSNRRVTIRDIAKVAGVHFTTVGLALRGSSQLPAATRERIQKIAEELGYRPDPMLSALNVYRRAKRPPRYQATLAWINNWPRREGLHKNPGFHEYFLGAKERAEKMGYVLEEFWTREPGMTPERLTGILRARGIEGLLLAPQPASHTFLPLDFTHFAVVSFGYSLQPSIFHVITNHHFHSMNMMLKHLMELGYRRIGFFGEQDWDEKVENSWIGGLALARWKYPDLEEVPPLLEKKTRDKDLASWIEAHRPDVVISYSGAEKWLRELGCRIPDEMGFASLSLHRPDEVLSGLYQHDRRIGQAAVDFVISMLHAGERGVPSVPTRILVESSWNEGTTLRRSG
jgi:DNA-binding LacI/PurR family transcriptional regulator